MMKLKLVSASYSHLISRRAGFNLVSTGMQGCKFKADDIQPDAKSAHEDSAFGTEVEPSCTPVYCQLFKGKYEAYCPKLA